MGPHDDRDRVHVGDRPWVPAEAAGQPDTTPPPPSPRRPAQARAGTPEPMRPVVLAVDATGMLVRCSRAGRIRPLAASDGTPTASLMMFINSLARKIRVTKPDHLVIAWDGPHARLWRRRLYPPYKANRPEQDFGYELRRAMEFCTAAGMRQLMVPGFEADDVLAAVQRAFYREMPEGTLMVCSDDADMLQLAADGTVITGLSTDVPITAADVESAWSIQPWRMAQVRALSGDKSDNIPGLPGVGAKTAVRMIRQADYAWPLPEHVLPFKEVDGVDQRRMVEVWREIIELVNPSRRSEEAAGMDHFSIAGQARWDAARASGKVLGLLEHYEMSALRNRLEKGVLWQLRNDLTRLPGWI